MRRALRDLSSAFVDGGPTSEFSIGTPPERAGFYPVLREPDTRQLADVALEDRAACRTRPFLLRRLLSRLDRVSGGARDVVAVTGGEAEVQRAGAAGGARGAAGGYAARRGGRRGGAGREVPAH